MFFSTNYEKRTHNRGKFFRILAVPVMFAIGYFLATGIMGLFM